MLSGVYALSLMPSVANKPFMLSDAMLNVVIPNVVVPFVYMALQHLFQIPFDLPIKCHCV